MNTHPDPRRFSDLLEGDLSEAEVRDLEDHLDGCDSCEAVLEDLRRIRAQARDLSDIPPARDLWPDIIRAIESGREVEEDPDVIRIHPGVSPLPARRRVPGIRLSLPQAAAAGLILALLSGAVGARVGQGSPSGVPGTLVESVGAGGAAWVRQVGEATPALASTASEVARLEEVLAEHEEELDPITAEILDRNMAIIDKAILESIEALQADPGNRFLQANLERAVVAKGEYLREATHLVAPIT